MVKNVTSTAIVLAGGMGTRLRSVVSNVPKPMAPIRNRPFLEYLLDYWINQGVCNFLLSVGYKANSIMDHFGTHYHGAHINYAVENEALGTGGALKYALHSLHELGLGGDVLVINGDTWFEVVLADLWVNYVCSKSPILIAIKKVNENSRYGMIKFDEMLRVTEFADANGIACFINGGVYLMNSKSIFDLMSSYPFKFELERDFLQKLVADYLLSVSLHDVPFLDIGIPEDYINASFVCGV